MMLAGAEAIAARGQSPGKSGNIVSLKNCQIQFVWHGYLLHAFWELWSFCDSKWRLRTQILGRFCKKIQQRKFPLMHPSSFLRNKCDVCNIFQFVGLKLVYKGGWFEQRSINFLIIHSKHFPVSDWLKPYAQFTITSYCWPNLARILSYRTDDVKMTSKVQPGCRLLNR